MKTRLIVTLILLAPAVSQAWPFGASSYEECMLEEMEGQPRNAIRFARQVCENRFPPPAPAEKDACEIIAKGKLNEHGVESWSAIITSTTFRLMPPALRERARIRYFEEVIAPATTHIDKERLRKAWDRSTKPARYVDCG